MDFFPIPELPEDFEIDPARTLEAINETTQTFYGRYIQGIKAIVDSYNIPVGLTPRKKSGSSIKQNYITTNPPDRPPNVTRFHYSWSMP